MLYDNVKRLFALLELHLISVLRVGWALLVVWCELGVFVYSVSDCRWPDRALASDVGLNHAPTHVLVVADPQILDHRSYPGRPPLMMSLSQSIVDLNIRKSWRVASWLFPPDVIVFLGDMMDDGRFAMPDEEYESYYARFKSIFRTAESTPVYCLPGNHDLGLGARPSFSPRARERYLSHFGPLNQEIPIGNYTLLLIDAVSLVEEDYERASRGLAYDRWTPHPGGTVEFVKSFSEEKGPRPVVLFSHIPLSRPETALCGPLRERGTIHRGVGYGYQNTLGRETSNFLLQGIRPSVIFSGDDHDYCEYMHTIADSGGGSSGQTKVREVTVKSFSMAMGIKRPGFQLLSLGPSSHSDAPCLLPDQIKIYLSFYVPSLLITLLLLLIWNIHTSRARPHPALHLRTRAQSPLPPSGASDDSISLTSSRSTPDLRARFDADEAAPFLPAPGSAPVHRAKRGRPQFWTPRLAVQRIWRGVHGVFSWRVGSTSRSGRRKGFARRFFGDVVDVAVPPVTAFVVIAWWMFSGIS